MSLALVDPNGVVGQVIIVIQADGQFKELVTEDVTGTFTPPAGTGFVHVTGGVVDGAAVVVDLGAWPAAGVLVGDLPMGTGGGDIAGTHNDALVAQISGSPAGTLVPVNTELRLVPGPNPTPILSFFEPPHTIATFGIMRWPQGNGVAGAGTAMGLYARNIAGTGDAQLFTYDAGGNVSIGVDGSLDGGVAIDAHGQISLGANVAPSINIDGNGGVDPVIAIGAGNANSIQIGRNGAPGGVSMPGFVPGGGGLVQADPISGLLGSTGYREDVLATGVGVAVPNGPGVVNVGPFTPPAGATLRIELFCTDLTPGETVGYVIASDTIAANFIQDVGGFFAQVANRSGGGVRHVNYRVIQSS